MKKVLIFFVVISMVFTNIFSYKNDLKPNFNLLLEIQETNMCYALKEFEIENNDIVIYENEEEEIENNDIILNENGDEVILSYLIYDDSFNLLDERIDCEIGDRIIDKDFNVYEIYFVDSEFYLAKACLVDKIEKNKIIKSELDFVSGIIIDKKIGLYMTHNDESFLIGDNISSVYGPGGIHDIAKKLAFELQKYDMEIYLDETLHIPHDFSAYSRSRITAKSLMENSLNAIFDIHRDGVARSNYVTQTNSETRCQIRIVLGLGNLNSDKNLEFATYLIQVAEEFYPWLFKDIYLANKTYNQDLSNKALLFEMGTYTIEKDMVIDSTVELAEIINTTLFETKIDENGNLIINNPEAETDTNIIIDEGNLDNETIDEYLENNNAPINLWVVGFSLAIFSAVIFVIFIRKKY